MEHELVLEKRVGRRSAPDAIQGQLSRIVERALGGSRRGIWELTGPIRDVRPADDPAGEGWLYRAPLRFRRVARAVGSDVEARQFEVIRRIAEEAAGARGWTVGGETAATAPAATASTRASARATGAAPSPAPVGRTYASVNATGELGQWFGHSTTASTESSRSTPR